MSDTHGMVAAPTTKGHHMTTFEFSDGFDAVGWYMEQMGKGHFEDDYYDEP